MIPSDLSRGIAPDFASGLIPGLPRVVAPRPREISPVALTAFPASRSPYAEEFLGAASPDSSPLPWPSRSLKRSALPCSPLGANMSTLQDSLNGTGCWFAPPSQRDTPLRHTGSPQCNGSLLRGSLAITATGLAPVSCQCLSGHTSAMLGSDTPLPPPWPPHSPSLNLATTVESETPIIKRVRSHAGAG
jgi:hypothetical protein